MKDLNFRESQFTNHKCKGIKKNKQTVHKAISLLYDKIYFFFQKVGTAIKNGTKITCDKIKSAVSNCKKKDITGSIKKYFLKTLSSIAIIVFGFCIISNFASEISRKRLPEMIPEENSIKTLMLASILPGENNHKLEKYPEIKTKDYTIKKGDTLDTIAKQHNTETQLLLLLNAALDERRLIPGSTIKIPSQS